MVDCSHYLLFIILTLEASCCLDNPIQRLMVQKSNARIENVMNGMVLALLSVPVTVNVARPFVALLFEKRKKTRWALRHTDFRGSRRISNPAIKVRNEHELPRFRVPQVKHRDEIILEKSCRSIPFYLLSHLLFRLICVKFFHLLFRLICVKFFCPCGEPLNAKRPNALLDLALPQHLYVWIACRDWIALTQDAKSDAFHFKFQSFDLGLQDLNLQDFYLDPQSGP